MEVNRKNFEKELITKIQQKLKGKETEESFLLKAFKFMDIAGSGKVNFDQFSGAIGRMGFALDKSALSKLFEQYDLDKDKLIDYKEFGNMVLGTKKAEAKPSSTDGRAKSLIETLKKKVNERGVKGLILLAKIFNLGDKGKVHNITLDEFKQAWREFKLGLDEADLEVIFREFDQDRDSLINSSEVFQAIKDDTIGKHE